MLRIKALKSFDQAVADAAGELAISDALRANAFTSAAGAAYDRICEQPGLGYPLGGGVISHSLVGFPFAVIYEVTDTEICFLYLAAFSK